jgi:hypothetical protein
MMCAWSVNRSISALHSRGFGMTCDHSENGRFVVAVAGSSSEPARYSRRATKRGPGLGHDEGRRFR